MSEQLDTLFTKPAFANLGKERLDMFRQFASDIEGKNAAETAIRFVRFNMLISKDNPLTPSERRAAAETIKDSLTEEEKAKYEKVLKLI